MFTDRMQRSLLATATAIAVATSGLVATQTASADEGTCTTVLESGTLKWGLKSSFRKYIKGRIANGTWTTSGNVTESGNATGADFTFNFEVDPATSKVEFNEDGTVKGDALIRTKDATLVFEGHHGALYTNIKSPYVQTSGNTAKVGVGYLGYYVPGKEMTAYTKDDRIEANKREGEDFLAAGTYSGLTNGTGTVTKVNYVPQPGTTEDGSNIEGVDVFL